MSTELQNLDLNVLYKATKAKHVQKKGLGSTIHTLQDTTKYAPSILNSSISTFRSTWALTDACL